ncbi:hypothetical protein [Streptomyces sp. NPDC049813]
MATLQTAREEHVDSVRALGELRDPVAEQVLDAITGVVEEQLTE